MGKAELIRRYIVFFVGISIGAFGVTLVTRSTLGVNSVACASYVTSVYFPVTMGQVNIAFNLFMLISQLVIMTKAQRRAQWVMVLMQIPAFVVFGLLLDFFMFLTRDYHPGEYGYWAEFLTLIAGTIIIAINICMQVAGGVTKLSCDAFVVVLAERIHRNIGTIKIIYDWTLVATAAVMSLVCSGFTEIVGIREGTLIGAFFVGYLVKLLYPHFKFCERWILRAHKEKHVPEAVDSTLTPSAATEQKEQAPAVATVAYESQQPSERK
ncbi:MAG: hypothetical protein H9847_10590 [Candidatus Anaerobiospirillum pullicola]|uniref:YitT family protein n=1 Tax=Candidatus Anaerobiospirillum pullicola TaxID=2838451 RepID=A0A948TI26_9GAMM|nr:hypothetical protein [Candidatus Anaerobiospirillum pullicola]